MTIQPCPSYVRRALVRCSLISLATAGTIACGQDPTSIGAVHEAAARASPSTFDPRTITLVTGDRVTLTGSPDTPTVRFEPGTGRGGIGYATVRHNGNLFVFPHDVASLVAQRSVDRALFNITQLLEEGFGDRERDDLPLILTGVAAAPAAFAASGLAISRSITVLHATALRQPKNQPGAALASLRAAQALSAGSPPRLWLDHPYKLVLDHSAPQIGAPTAWARGFTGAGVTVAVIDGGVDEGSPDLHDKVVDAVSLMEDDLGTGDINGHGTHVASIIAGTGAASGGLYRGVAPDAQLISARVCTSSRNSAICPTSAILAAMAWAVVDKQATIVNLSLGAPDDPEIDPLEDAVNHLSVQYGTLFVIAAGNVGGERSILSPGSAEAALTVGAVDRDDQLAVFSSRGPTAAGGVIKPDLTAPGVGIVAARAISLPPIGDTVGDAYQRLSGTSMATPHVAGAAALLRQQHPSWTGAQIKAALIDSAKPDPSRTADEQGAGRVDVDRATSQSVLVQPPSVDLGIARWPHTDDPILTRTLTYRNDGNSPITLGLTASITTLDHTVAPANMIRIAPASLTVPAGGNADAQVSIDTNGDAPDVRYAGSVVATAGGTRLVTPVAVEREVASYDLALRQLDVAGREADSATVLLTARKPNSPVDMISIRDTPTIHLPRDSYSLHAFHDSFLLAQPNLLLDRERVVTFDDRLARPIEVAVPGVDLTPKRMFAMSWDVSSNFEFSDEGNEIFTAHLGPALADDEYRAWVSVAAVPAGSGVTEPQVGDPKHPGVPDQYGFAHQERGRFVTGWQATIPRESLATVDSVVTGPSGSVYRKFLGSALADIPGSPALGLAAGDYAPGVHRTEHLFGPGLQWIAGFTQLEPSLGEPLRFFSVTDYRATRSYQPGKHYIERYNEAPYGPALADIDGRPAATRRADTLTISPSMYTDRVLPSRANVCKGLRQHSTLFRDGALLTQSNDLIFLPIQVSPSAASYRFEADYERGPNPLDGSPLFDLSTHVTASWTFWSQHEPGTRILPLPTLRFLPELEADGRATGPVLLLPAVVERPAGAAAPRITSVTVDVSFDDGATWARVRGGFSGDRWLGLVAHPPGAAFASLRGAVHDAEGRRSDLTIIHAYRIAR